MDADEDTLRRRFLELVVRNDNNRAILERLPELGVQDTWLVAGCLFGSVWNGLSERPPGENINDYDIFYFDPDTSYKAEDAVIRRGDALFADLGVDVEIRNQARVPLWFEQRFGSPCPPIGDSRTGIDRFVVAGTCCGISQNGQVYAPYGFTDMFAGILRRNPKNPTPDQFAYKCESYQVRWPWLNIVTEAGPAPVIA